MSTSSSDPKPTNNTDHGIREDAPAIQAHRVVDYREPVPRYGQNRWSLASMESDDTRERKSLNFETWPAGFRSLAKEYAFGLINHGTPKQLLEQATFGSWTVWPGPGTIQRSLQDLKRAIDWFVGDWSALHPDTPVVNPSDIDTGHFDDLRQWIATKSLTSKTHYDTLDAVRRLWHMDDLMSPENRLPAPTWMLERSLKRRGEENETARVSQRTMAPLITWACAFVEDFAVDIIGAHQHYAEAMRNVRSQYEFRKQDCLDIIHQYPDRVLPGQNYHRERGTDRAAWQVLEYRHKASRNRLASTFFRLADKSSYRFTDDIAAGSIDYVPTGKIRGSVWIDGISVLEVCPRGRSGQNGSDRFSVLTMHLQTACLIVVAYLTGARPEEVLGLEFGAAKPPVARSDGGRLYRISGRSWKGLRRDEEGRPPEPAQVEWATISVAWKAIQVLEQLRGLFGSASGFLFTRTTGRVTRSDVASSWITEFIDFVNNRLVPVSSLARDLRIPADPDGPVTLRRFRRTLAWFLCNQPGGEITLAIQYQHLRTTMASGYAGTKGSGMATLMRDEDWAHRRSTIQQLGHLLATGVTLHGPAANRALMAVDRLPQHLTPSEERRLKRDPDLVLYDNPGAIALCAFQSSTALCVSSSSSNVGHPRFDRCLNRCANIARTRDHLIQITQRAESLRSQAAISPTPIAHSLIGHATELDRIAQNAEVGKGYARD